MTDVEVTRQIKKLAIGFKLLIKRWKKNWRYGRNLGGDCDWS